MNSRMSSVSLYINASLGKMMLRVDSGMTKESDFQMKSSVTMMSCVARYMLLNNPNTGGNCYVAMTEITCLRQNPLPITMAGTSRCSRLLCTFMHNYIRDLQQKNLYD